MGSVEADDERQITVADDWQLQRLAHSSSTNIDLHYQLMFLTFITLFVTLFVCNFIVLLVTKICQTTVCQSLKLPVVSNCDLPLVISFRLLLWLARRSGTHWQMNCELTLVIGLI